MDLKAEITVIFWLVVGVGVTLGSIHLGIGRVSNPGAGFMCFYSGLLLIILSLLLGISEIRKKGSQLSSPLSLSIGRNLIVAFCSLVGFVLILETLGYLIATGLFIFVLLKVTAPKKWLGPLFWAIGVSLATYFLFSVLLECNFPKGIFNLG
jgi:putative tricarboxylic transport membrane protein